MTSTVHGHLVNCLSRLSTFSRLQSLHEISGPPARLVRDTPSAQALRRQLSRLAAMDEGPGAAPPPILLTGEVGTGKGVVAREIHAEATAAMPGLSEVAEGGTVFLDEVEALPLALQGRLLEALTEQSVRRLGAGAATPYDARVIVATHVDLGEAVGRGIFRADLLDRFRLAQLTLRPLRERPDDIVPLARYFVGQLTRRQASPPRLTADAEEQLRRYRWPGNVRELSEVIARAAGRGEHEEIGTEALGLPPP
jgi:DNA-binding NtrC family response regulator